MTDEAMQQNQKAWENLRVYFPADFVGVMALKEVGQVLADRRFQMTNLNPDLLEALIERLAVIEQHGAKGTYRANFGVLAGEILRWLKVFPSDAYALIDEACRNWWLRVNRGAANEIGPLAQARLSKLSESMPLAAAYLVYYHGTCFNSQHQEAA